MKILNLICLFGILGLAGYAQNAVTGTLTIEVELAQFVAGQHVQLNNKPFEWRSVDHMVLHDVEGGIMAYAFVFAKAETGFRSPADLHRHIQEKAAQLSKAREKAANAKPESQAEVQTPGAVVEAEENLYNFNDLATVITGATTDSPLILRHFRGLPEFWVAMETLDSAASAGFYGKSLQVSRAIMITPMDFRLVASEGTERALTTADLRKAQKAMIPDSAQVLTVNGKRIEKMSTVREASQNIEKRKQQRLNTLKPADQQKYQRALQDRSKALASEWDQHRELWLKGQAERGQRDETVPMR